MTPALLRKAIKRARAIQASRPRPQSSTFTPEAVAAGHGKQLALMVTRALYVIVLCSRRAGKTFALAEMLAAGALSGPRRNLLYIALSRGHAKRIMWGEIWKPMLAKWGVECRHNETELHTTFPNGSIVYFSGTDDVANIQKNLGFRLSMAVVDEAQSQSDSVLVPLVTTILPNALLDDPENPGQLIMAGTIPDAPAGHFLKVWNEGTWERHNWNRFENPHLGDQQKMLDVYMRANPGITVEDPQVQREWYGKFVFDPLATAYRYSVTLNGYVPTVPAWLREDADVELTAGRFKVPALWYNGEPVAAPDAVVMAAKPFDGIDVFSVGIDPGSTSDRFSVVVRGWGSKDRTVQDVFIFVTPRGSQITWGQIAPVLRVVQKRFAPIWWQYDAGSSMNELDVFRKDYGVPAIAAAKKVDLPGQVRRNNDLLTQGRLKVMIGSPIEEDYQKARWDVKARANGQYKWASQWHPDPSEAARYALAPYFDASHPAATEEERHREFRKAQAERAERNRKATQPDDTYEKAEFEDDSMSDMYDGD